MNDLTIVLMGVFITISLSGTLAWAHGPFGISVILRKWIVIFFGNSKWAQKGIKCIVCMSLWAGCISSFLIGPALSTWDVRLFFILALFYSGVISLWQWHYFGWKEPSPPPLEGIEIIAVKKFRTFWELIGFQYESKKKKAQQSESDNPKEESDPESEDI